jgi:hypothetical protein
MEENKPEIIDVTLIPKDFEVSFKVDSNMHTRLQQLLLNGIGYKDPEHFNKCLKQIADNNIDDPIAYHMQTVLYLIEQYEFYAREQKVMVTKKFSFAENKFLDDDKPTG